jgi:small conductance mechanosensitive channel
MLGKPEVLGVQEIGPSGMTIRILAKTKPVAQGDIERELRKTIKLRFDEEKVEMPFP